MLPHVMPRVNAPLLIPLLGLLGCREAPPVAHARRPTGAHLGPTREVVDQGRAFTSGLEDSFARGHLRREPRTLHVGELHGGPARRPGEESVMSALGADLTDVEIDMDRGQELLAYAEENVPSARWSNYGLMSLTEEEIWGDDGYSGYCEEGAVLDTFEEDGVEYEASYNMAVYAHFLDGPTAVMVDLEAACQEALLTAAGDLDAALDSGDCDEFDEATFFPEDSTCRDCLEEGAGDFAACVDGGECLEEAPYTQWIQDGSTGEKWWFQTAEADVWACAPDLTSTMYVFGNFGSDGSLPETFDHYNWAFFCLGFWNTGTASVTYTCGDGTGGWQYGHTLGEGALARADYIRPVGEEGTPHNDRLWYAHTVEIRGGPTIQYFWSTAPGSAQFSMAPPIAQWTDPQLAVPEDPLGMAYGSTWNLNPKELRPDGTDPTRLDDTRARDWLAALTLKTATNIDGIQIKMSNHNRCVDGAWEGPFEDGSYRCTEIGPPAVDWHEDSRALWTANLEGPGEDDYAQYTWFAMTTLGSTGLPDPRVPGGSVPMIAGTAALADEDWEGCTWPTEFVPDTTSYEERPQGWRADLPLWGDTWRFGAHPELDLRMVLATGQLRDWCPEEEGWEED